MNNKLKFISLFSGIGAFEKALTNIGIDYDLINFCENDEYAIKSFCKIHDVSNDFNLGDITKINIENLPLNIDLITHGSPCQDFSCAGLNKGGDKNSGTRSSLMWNTVSIVEHCKPKYVIWENVPNVLSNKHIHNFNKYIDTMKNIGYNNYYKVLNSKDFNVPHDRSRIFTVSIRNDINIDFEFPTPVKLERFLLDFLDITNDKENVSEIVSSHIDTHYENKIKNKKDYPITVITEIRPSRCSIKTNGISPCLVAKMGTGGNNVPIIAEWKRPFTINECMRIMGFDDNDYDNIINSGNPKGQLYKQIGNSIQVNVLEAIFKNLFKIN